MKFNFSKLFAGFALAVLLSFLSINTVQAKSTIEWQPERLEIRQTENSTQTYTLQVNFNKAATDVIGRVVPALEEWISVNPVSFGDVSAGDTIELELIVSIPSDEATAIHGGVVQLRGGKNQKNLAKPLNVSLTIIPETSDGLPPDPGEAGKETLLGIDSDMDGVRDDIQRYIALTYSDQPDLQKALFQISRAYQLLLDPELIEGTERNIAKTVDEAGWCLNYILGGATIAYDTFIDLRAQTLNTRERSIKFLKYDSKLSGKTFEGALLPISERFRYCEFDIVR